MLIHTFQVNYKLLSLFMQFYFPIEIGSCLFNFYFNTFFAKNLSFHYLNKINEFTIDSNKFTIMADSIFKKSYYYYNYD